MLRLNRRISTYVDMVEVTFVGLLSSVIICPLED